LFITHTKGKILYAHFLGCAIIYNSLSGAHDMHAKFTRVVGDVITKAKWDEGDGGARV